MVKSEADLLAGPELDALVAEKVMSWQRDDKGYFEDGIGWISIWRKDGNPVGHAVASWRPSTDMNDAIKVAKKAFFHCRFDHATELGVWRVSSDERPDICEIERSLPLAICRAALKAMNCPNNEETEAL